DIAIGLNLSVAATSISATSYNIISRTPDASLVVVTAPAVANNVGAAFLANDVFRNTTSTPRDVTYVVTANGSINSCFGDPRTIVVTINPEPVVSSTLDHNVCSDDATALTLDTAPTSV